MEEKDCVCTYCEKKMVERVSEWGVRANGLAT